VLTILVSPSRGVSEMDTNSTDVILLRVSRRAVKKIAIVGVVGCLAVTGLANAVSGIGASLGTQADVVSVERSHKGDRLQLAPKHTLTVPWPVVITLSRPPIGCEPAFSRVADPKRSHVFGRCLS
jgi:hypothetical protein